MRCENPRTDEPLPPSIGEVNIDGPQGSNLPFRQSIVQGVARANAMHHFWECCSEIAGVDNVTSGFLDQIVNSADSTWHCSTQGSQYPTSGIGYYQPTNQSL